MPFYEYECSSCGEQAEILQKISDAPARKCPSCGKSALKRLISAPVFRLKGSGWYETDFKSDQDRKRNLAGSDDSGDAASSDAKTDTKADAKDAKDGKGADAKSEKATDKPVLKPKPAETSASGGSASKQTASKSAPKTTAKKSKPVAKKKSAKR